MKIVSWNCNGRFRDKIENILSYNADLYVIQESENPYKYIQQFKNKIKTYYWFGLNDNKGLLVFSNSKIKVSNNNWENYGLRHFISLKINDSFDLIGVWASPPYIEEYYIYQQINKSKYNNSTIIIGDFNSNSIWDKEHKERNHSAVVQQLEEFGLFSAYHTFYEEKQGKETQSTFCLHRNMDKGYHIDFCFVDPKRLKNFEIGNKNKWLSYSDHMPIIVDIVNTQD